MEEDVVLVVGRLAPFARVAHLLLPVPLQHTVQPLLAPPA